MVLTVTVAAFELCKVILEGLGDVCESSFHSLMQCLQLGTHTPSCLIFFSHQPGPLFTRAVFNTNGNSCTKYHIGLKTTRAFIFYLFIERKAESFRFL